MSELPVLIAEEFVDITKVFKHIRLDPHTISRLIGRHRKKTKILVDFCTDLKAVIGSVSNLISPSSFINGSNAHVKCVYLSTIICLIFLSKFVVIQDQLAVQLRCSSGDDRIVMLLLPPFHTASFALTTNQASSILICLSSLTVWRCRDHLNSFMKWRTQTSMGGGM